MSERDKERIKVRSSDFMCFYVDVETLEPLGCSCYDPYCYSDPESCEHMSFAKWSTRKHN